MIYFIKEVGLFRNRVKIGFTNNIKGRLTNLRGGSPSQLKLLLAIPGDNQTEIVYHEYFAKYRLHGEWFSYGLRLRWFVWLNRFKSLEIEDIETDILTNVLSEPEEPSWADEPEEPSRADEPEEPSRADVIRTLHSEGLNNQQIARHFGYQTCSGRIFYQIKDALNGDA